MKKTPVILLLLILACSFAHAQTKTLLIARTSGTKVLDDGREIRTFGFASKLKDNPGIPGPTLVYYEGDSVTIDMWNVSQNSPHTIHLHGLDVDQQNDGVPHLSFEIQHMEHGYYRFKAPHPGTYLYHCHVVSAIHVQAGMYGLLIVKPKNEHNKTWKGGFEYIKDYNLLFSEIDTVWHHDSVLNHGHQTEIELPDWNPSYFLCNGLSGNQLKDLDSQNYSINGASYIRLANVGYSGNRIVFPKSLNVRLIDSDGRPLPKVIRTDTILVHPGERYGVLFEPKMIHGDSIKVEFFDLNNMRIQGTMHLPFQTSNLVSVPNSIANLPDIKVFPNPTQGSFIIKSQIRDIQGVNLTNALGQTVPVRATKTRFGEYSVELDATTSGFYILTVTRMDGTSSMVRLVVE